MTAAMIPTETVSAESRAMTNFPEAPRSCLPKGAPVVPERRRHVQAKRLWERDPGPKPRARHDAAEVAPALASVAPIRAGVGDQNFADRRGPNPWLDLGWRRSVPGWRRRASERSRSGFDKARVLVLGGFAL